MLITQRIVSVCGGCVCVCEGLQSVLTKPVPLEVFKSWGSALVKGWEVSGSDDCC